MRAASVLLLFASACAFAEEANTTKGEQISSTKLVHGPGGLANAIPKGMRAWPVALDPLAAAVVEPGMFVDVMMNVPARHGRHPGFDELRCVTLLQNVAVVSVGSAVAPAPRTPGALPTTMTLLLSPDEVQRLVVAESVGALRFSFRGAAEGNSQVPLEKVTVEDAIGIPGQVRTRQPPPLHEGVLVWFEQQLLPDATDANDDGQITAGEY